MHEPACKNKMTVLGNKEDIQSFMDWVSTSESPISLEKAIPIPDEVKSLDPNLITPSMLEKYGAIDPMTWKDENWGVFKDFMEVKLTADVELDDEETEMLTANLNTGMVANRIVAYSYVTQCIPPLHAYRRFSEEHPNLMFHMSFDVDTTDKHNTCGFLLVKAGKMLKRWFNPMSYRSFQAQMDGEGGFSSLLALAALKDEKLQVEGEDE
jgi:hypothetical protein